MNRTRDEVALEVKTFRERVVAFLRRDYEDQELEALLCDLDDRGKLALFFARGYVEARAVSEEQGS